MRGRLGLRGFRGRVVWGVNWHVVGIARLRWTMLVESLRESRRRRGGFVLC